MPFTIERQDRPGIWHRPTDATFSARAEAQAELDAVFAERLVWRRSDFRIRETDGRTEPDSPGDADA